MKNTKLFSLIIICSSLQAQTFELKSLKHGLEMKVKDVSKEIIIGEILFDDGIDSIVDVIRWRWHISANHFFETTSGD